MGKFPKDLTKQTYTISSTTLNNQQSFFPQSRKKKSQFITEVLHILKKQIIKI